MNRPCSDPYKVQWRELRACDYGAPTIRKRWFLVARRDRRPIVWPKPTHGDPGSAPVQKGKLLPWRTAAECIDWSLPCPSIFDTGAEVMAKHGLRAVRPLAGNTLARVARGMKRYVLEAEWPFLVNLTHGGRVEDAAEPFRTITAAHRGEKAAVVPIVSQMYGSGGGRGDIDRPLGTVTADGQHASLIAASVQRFNTGATGQDMRDPMATITANSWIKKPGGAAPLGVLAPYLATFYGHDAQRGKRAADLAEPLRTVTVENRHALIAPVLTYAQQGGGNRAASAPHHTICASRKDQNSLIAAAMVQTGYGERPGQAPRALDVAAPLGTVVAGGAKHAPVAAFLAQHNGCPRMGAHAGHDPRAPISTIAGSGSHQMPVAAWMAKWYGTDQDPRLDAPLHTVTTKDRFDVEVAQLAAPPFSAEHQARARAVAEFLRAHDAWHGGEFVTLTIGGASYVVIDIGMRMLTPRELFRAQGFPADYVIEGVWEGLDGDSPVWRAFPKDVQVSCCGNAVCPPLAEALVAANCGHLRI